MKRFAILVVLIALGLQIADPALAARRVVVKKRPHRTTVVVHRGWPLERAQRTVVVRPARVTVRVHPVTYKEEGWTEFTLACDARGERLWLEIASGKAQFDWAEVVFENGDTRVVDFKEKAHKPGLYSLLDFKDGRRVDHVRMVARARSDEAKVVLRMQK